MCRRKKIVWCDQEDKILIQLVSHTDKPDWGKIALELHKKHGYKKKTNRQCRERWHNILNPGIVKQVWTRQEQDILFEQHRQLGNKWALIAKMLPGRTDNFIKNHFYSVIRKSLRRINKFLGKRDGTAKIKKIKPSTLSLVFSLENEKQISKLNSNIERSLVCDESEGKEAVYHLINFSRINLSKGKSLLEPSEAETLRCLLEQISKFNEKYQKNKQIQQKKKREDLKLIKFDKVIEKQEQEEREASQKSCSEDEFSNSELQSSSLLERIKKNQKRDVIDIENDEDFSLSMNENCSATTPSCGQMEMLQFAVYPPKPLFQQILSENDYAFDLQQFQNEENFINFEDESFGEKTEENIQSIQNPFLLFSSPMPQIDVRGWIQSLQYDLQGQGSQSQEPDALDDIRLKIEKRMNNINKI